MWEFSESSAHSNSGKGLATHDGILPLKEEDIITPHPGEAARLLEQHVEFILDEPLDALSRLHDVRRAGRIGGGNPPHGAGEGDALRNRAGQGVEQLHNFHGIFLLL